MHHSAYLNAERFYNKYCKTEVGGKSVLDVGSYDVNGTLKPIFEKEKYTGFDLDFGPNVDIVGSAESLPFDNDSFDIIVSSSCFEHDDFFWLSFLEICRVVKPGGYIYVQAPSNGPYHAHPKDNWRFYIDSWEALLKWGVKNGYHLELVEHYIDTVTPDPFQQRLWDDSIAIYRKIDVEKMEINVNSIENGHRNVTYRGIPMFKCPFDYVTYQMIINEIKPDLVIEIGTYYGGNAVYIADLLEAIGKGEVHTIDVENFNDGELLNSHKRIKRFFGGYQNYDLKNTHNAETILVIDDGSHTYSDVKASLEKFNKIVSVNSYFIVEDGVLTELGKDNAIYNGGPLRATHEFLRTTDSYTVDRKWIDFFGKNATFNKNGFLKRIK